MNLKNKKVLITGGTGGIGNSLIKQFNDRQIQISPSLIEFILKRITRSMASIGSFVEELDRTVLKLGKSANRAIISEVLDKFS